VRGGNVYDMDGYAMNELTNGKDEGEGMCTKEETFLAKGEMYVFGNVGLGNEIGRRGRLYILKKLFIVVTVHV